MATTLSYQHSHRQVQASSGLEVLAGIWLIIAPFALSYATQGGSIANDIIVGILVLALALVRSNGDDQQTTWASWGNLILGIWLILAPFALGYPSGSGAMYNDILMGIIVGALALWSAYASPVEEEQ